MRSVGLCPDCREGNHAECAWVQWGPIVDGLDGPGANLCDCPCIDEEPESASSKPSHWYFISIFRCPVCGSEEEYRSRRFDPRPDDWYARHEFIDHYDWCNG